MSYIKCLEDRLEQISDELEDIHLEAAIDAQLTNVTTTPSSPSSSSSNNKHSNNDNENVAIFNDYTNPNSVLNCLSPYVPCKSKQIEAFFSQAGFDKSKNNKEHVLLDIGCGDGRVCISAVKMFGCKAIGIDVSPPCISMARNIAKEEGILDDTQQCQFYQFDATTIDPNQLFLETPMLHKELKSVTTIFLYIYPTLLLKLIPFLSYMTNNNTKLLIATVTYHIIENNNVKVNLEWKDNEHDICFYSKVFYTNNDEK